MRATEYKKINKLSMDDQYLECIWDMHERGKKDQEIANELKLSTEIVSDKIRKMVVTISKARNSSNHFCHEHNPDPSTKSRYRADIRYKYVFQHELQALKGRNLSRFMFLFPKPPGADEQELRKTAYDQVHAGIRPLNNMNSPSLLEDIFILQSHGMTQAEIARKLSKPRQTVYERMKVINDLRKKRQNEQLIYHDSEESWQKSMDSSLVQQVIDLHTKGYTVSDIANKTNRFKHTIHSVHSWLDLSPNTRQSA